jgi:hypothetical protein
MSEITEDNVTSLHRFEDFSCLSCSSKSNNSKSKRIDISFVHLVVVIMMCITKSIMNYYYPDEKRERGSTLDRPLSDLPLEALRMGVPCPFLLP